MIDYKELLAKYIAHIIYCEGVSFIDEFNINAETDSVRFTKKEIKALEKEKNNAINLLK